MRRPGVTMFAGREKRSAGDLRAWEFGDPAEVAERREDEALGRVAAQLAREQADQVIEAARVAPLIRDSLGIAPAPEVDPLRWAEMKRMAEPR